MQARRPQAAVPPPSQSFLSLTHSVRRQSPVSRGSRRRKSGTSQSVGQSESSTKASKLRSHREIVPSTSQPHSHHIMASSPPPTLRLDAAAKSATTVLLPLAIALHLSEVIPQPIQVQWQAGVKDSVELQPAETGSQSVSGVALVARWLVNNYAETNIAGKDQTQSSQVR